MDSTIVKSIGEAYSAMIGNNRLDKLAKMAACIELLTKAVTTRVRQDKQSHSAAAKMFTTYAPLVYQVILDIVPVVNIPHEALEQLAIYLAIKSTKAALALPRFPIGYGCQRLDYALHRFFENLPISDEKLSTVSDRRAIKVDGVEQSTMETSSQMCDVANSLAVGNPRVHYPLQISGALNALEYKANVQPHGGKAPDGIHIWADMDMKLGLLAIPSTQAGRPLQRILEFLESVCGSFNSNEFQLHNMKTGVVISATHLGSHVLPGDYGMLPIAGAHPLAITFEGVPLIRQAKRTRSNTSLGVSTHNDLQHRAEEFRLAEGTNSDEGLRERLFQRDNHCIISHRVNNLKAAHIIAYAWWRNSTNGRSPLPDEVQRLIDRLPNKIHNVQNGILLADEFADAFEKGKIAFRYIEDKLTMVAMDLDYERLDGLRVDENLRLCCSGMTPLRPWWSHGTKPHPTLIDYHFRCSVLKVMRTRASPLEFEDDDSADEAPSVLRARTTLRETLGTIFEGRFPPGIFQHLQ